MHYWLSKPIKSLGLFLALTLVFQSGVCPLTVRKVQAQQPIEQVLIILDASGSMATKTGDGETRLEAAKQAIRQFVQTLPSNKAVALRVYGSSRWAGCQSGRLFVPMGLNNKIRMDKALNEVIAYGPTPISLNLIRAINDDFLALPGKRKIILISDGAETCQSDPCGVAVDMVRNSVQVNIDVVGFGQLEYPDIKQLRCIAASTLGQFQQASTRAELAKALDKLVPHVAQVSGKVLSPAGNQQQKKDSQPQKLPDFDEQEIDLKQL